MKVGVLLKQVPASDTRIKINGDASGIVTDEVKWEINPYDEFALEAALQLKEAGTASAVVLLTLGDKDAEGRIKDAVARGAGKLVDDAIRIDDPALAGSDSLGIARALAAAASKAGVQLLLAGKQAIDTDNAQVPSMVAELLDWAQVSVVTELTVEGGSITAHRDAGGGDKEVVQTSLPAVITCDKGLNSPRFASLKGIMMAKRQKISTWGIGDLGLDAGSVGAAGALVNEGAYSEPPPRPSGRVINLGSPEANVKELVRLLREEAKVI